MEKPQVGKENSLPYFIHSTEAIPLNFGQNSDGFKILACHLFYRPTTKR
jgi:hypothetical protein